MVPWFIVPSRAQFQFLSTCPPQPFCPGSFARSTFCVPTQVGCSTQVPAPHTHAHARILPYSQFTQVPSVLLPRFVTVVAFYSYPVLPTCTQFVRVPSSDLPRFRFTFTFYLTLLIVYFYPGSCAHLLPHAHFPLRFATRTRTHFAFAFAFCARWFTRAAVCAPRALRAAGSRAAARAALDFARCRRRRTPPAAPPLHISCCCCTFAAHGSFAAAVSLPIFALRLYLYLLLPCFAFTFTAPLHTPLPTTVPRFGCPAPHLTPVGSPHLPTPPQFSSFPARSLSSPAVPRFRFWLPRCLVPSSYAYAYSSVYRMSYPTYPFTPLPSSSSLVRFPSSFRPAFCVPHTFVPTRFTLPSSRSPTFTLSSGSPGSLPQVATFFGCCYVTFR